MATNLNRGGASALPPMLPLDVLLSALPSLPRPLLARLTARLIDRLDEIDGDPDLEQTNDEGDPYFPQGDEYRQFQTLYGSGAGCPISCPDFGVEDVGEEHDDTDTRAIADPQAYREHRNRLRRERCFSLQRVRSAPYGYQARVLYQEPTALTKRQLLKRKRGIPRRPRA